ncbi:helix-turn-helix transcriptional regulator [Variovorax sp. E3]|uniref:helix-turn-helix domain-containing protein n=1 Tax=Variovorax sp. E3 TaxID=1914993 RepID=UPI0018DCB265|nr:helix-turn-helix transcriptional regulator [Variovorax sp. E3]
MHGVERPALTAREAEVLRWTADGKTCEEVALLLRISVNTVKFHVRNAVEKLSVANKTAAAANAVALGLL